MGKLLTIIRFRIIMLLSPKSDKKEESFYGREQRKIFCTDHIVQ